MIEETSQEYFFVIMPYHYNFNKTRNEIMKLHRNPIQKQHFTKGNNKKLYTALKFVVTRNSWLIFMLNFIAKLHHYFIYHSNLNWHKFTSQWWYY